MPPATVTFNVTGIPQPQGSKTPFKVGDRVVLVEGRRGPARAAFKSWREAVTHEARQASEQLGRTITGPVVVACTFRFPTVKSDPYRRAHTTRPDVDKLARCVLDALTQSGLIVDDSQVSALVVDKFHTTGTPGVTVEVVDCSDVEDAGRADRKQRAAEARKRARAEAKEAS